MIAELFIGMAGFYVGCSTGYVIGQHMYNATPEQIAEIMSRVVNMEEFEEHEKLVKVRLARSGRKSYRVDSGPNARVKKMRMRIRKRPRRTPPA